MPPFTINLSISSALFDDSLYPPAPPAPQKHVLAALYVQCITANDQPWCYLSQDASKNYSFLRINTIQAGKAPATPDPFNPDNQPLVPAFTTIDQTQISTTISIPIPESITEADHSSTPITGIQSGRIVFGVGTLPEILVNSVTDPKTKITTWSPASPVPNVASIYDFLEFSYVDQAHGLYINTTMIDQFGFPIYLQVDPPDTQNNNTLADGVGVTVPRAQVFGKASGSYQDFVGAKSPYMQCIQDIVGTTRVNRILSPQAALNYNCIAGVVFVAPPNADAGTLTSGTTYYYAISPVDASTKAEGYCQPQVQQTTPNQYGTVEINWQGTREKSAQSLLYNVYRGTSGNNGITWVRIAKNIPDCAYFDQGSTLSNDVPTPNPLVMTFDKDKLAFFDADIQALFSKYAQGQPALTLSATDGTTTSPTYNFEGNTVDNDPSEPPYLLFNLVSIVTSTTSITKVPQGTLFKIYYPYWNTNTFNPNNPNPPKWMLNNQWENDMRTPASMMVLAANGVFADNKGQMTFNPIVQGDAVAYSTLLGSLENQIVAALTRGVADLTPDQWTVSSQFFPTRNAWSAYDKYFHQDNISKNGYAYASPFDDQGGYSSTLTTKQPATSPNPILITISI